MLPLLLLLLIPLSCGGNGDTHTEPQKARRAFSREEDEAMRQTEETERENKNMYRVGRKEEEFGLPQGEGRSTAHCAGGPS